MPEGFFDGITLAQILNNGLASAIVIAFIVWAFKYTGPALTAWNNFTNAIQQIQGNCASANLEHKEEHEELKDIATATLRTVERIDTIITNNKGGRV